MGYARNPSIFTVGQQVRIVRGKYSGKSGTVVYNGQFDPVCDVEFEFDGTVYRGQVTDDDMIFDNSPAQPNISDTEWRTVTEPERDLLSGLFNGSIEFRIQARINGVTNV